MRIVTNKFIKYLHAEIESLKESVNRKDKDIKILSDDFIILMIGCFS